MDKPYTVNLDSEGRWYPHGPGDGFGYNSGLLWPNTRCATQDEAMRIVDFMNRAYAQGSRYKAKEIRSALGLN